MKIIVHGPHIRSLILLISVRNASYIVSPVPARLTYFFVLSRNADKHAAQHVKRFSTCLAVRNKRATEAAKTVTNRVFILQRHRLLS